MGKLVYPKPSVPDGASFSQTGAAKLLGMSEKWLRNKRDEGKIQPYRYKGKMKFYYGKAIKALWEKEYYGKR